MEESCFKKPETFLLNIAIIGASGRIGSRIALEALQRGHKVTAVVRDSKKVEEMTDVTVIEKDIFALSNELQSFDVVVSAYGTKPGDEHLHIDANKKLIALAHEAPNTRLIVVGGAGSLFVDDQGTRVLDTLGFPDIYLATAMNQGEALSLYLADQVIDWIFLSPAAEIEPGERSGTYQSGKDHLLVN
jgi:putative NADH-flavin reductase